MEDVKESIKSVNTDTLINEIMSRFHVGIFAFAGESDSRIVVMGNDYEVAGLAWYLYEAERAKIAMRTHAIVSESDNDEAPSE